jgi:hypothetical protein
VQLQFLGHFRELRRARGIEYDLEGAHVRKVSSFEFRVPSSEQSADIPVRAVESPGTAKLAQDPRS